MTHTLELEAFHPFTHTKSMEVEAVGAVAVSENEVLSNWQWNMTSKAGAKAKLQGSYLFRFRGEKIERIVGLWDIENTNRVIEDLEKRPS